MKRSNLYRLLAAALVLIPFSAAYAGDVSIPNTFQSGTTAVASEVNANFTAVKTAVDDNNSRIAQLEALVATLETLVAAQATLVATLQGQVEALETSNVMALDSYISVDEESDGRGPLVQLSGVNLQIVNGLGTTDTVNGLGNLIVGYDEINIFPNVSACSDGSYADQTSCEGAGEVWGISFKTGSHYLVLGTGNNYSQYGGLVAGYQNFATNAYANVTGGRLNLSRGNYSSVSAGYNSTASSYYSSVSGGFQNTASGNYSSVSGGYQNTASGDSSSVSGGAGRSVTFPSSWAAGSLYEMN